MGVDDIARSIAASGLEGAQEVWPSAPLTDVDWRLLLRRVREERLAGLLVRALERGTLPVTEEQVSQARTEHFDGVCRVLMLETGALQVVRLLSAAGVTPRVLKGAAVARLDYPDPDLRLFVDVDLIVSSAQFDRAAATLTAAGCVRPHKQPRPGFDRRFNKGASFIADERFVVDLHRTFVMGPFGLRVDLDDVWGPGSPFSIGGTELHALDGELRFLHACFHTALGDSVPRLVPQRDVAQMLTNGRLDVARVTDLMRRWDVEVVVATAVSHTWRTLRLAASPPLVDWALGYRPPARAVREMALYLDPNRSYARTSFGALRVVPGLRDKMAFLYALAFPERSYVEGRYASPRERWWQALRAVARLER
jgi:Uncharacterised nucleotidyltransferase